MTNQENADWSGYCPSPTSKKHYFPPSPSKIVGDMNSFKEGAACAWQTEARSVSAQTKTSRDQLTESGKSMFIRGKACTKPAHRDGIVPHSIKDKEVGLARGSGQEIKQDEKNAENDFSESLVGYRSGVDAKSFLSDLGAEIAALLSSSSKKSAKEE